MLCVGKRDLCHVHENPVNRKATMTNCTHFEVYSCTHDRTLNHGDLSHEQYRIFIHIQMLEYFMWATNYVCTCIL